MSAVAQPPPLLAPPDKPRVAALPPYRGRSRVGLLRRRRSGSWWSEPAW
jgi:hypothetical protein